MQKIFVKKCSVSFWVGISLGVMILVFFLFLLICKGGWDGDTNLFLPISGATYGLLWLNNDMILPEYLYLAPLTPTDRQKLVKKELMLRRVAIAVPFFLLGILPLFLYGLISELGSAPLWCILEFIILCNVLIVRDYIPHMRSKRENGYEVIEIILLTLGIIFGVVCVGGLENFKFSEIASYKADVILASLGLIFSCTAGIYCVVKYRKQLYEILADYEMAKKAKAEIEKRWQEGKGI